MSSYIKMLVRWFLTKFTKNAENPKVQYKRGQQ